MPSQPSVSKFRIGPVVVVSLLAGLGAALIGVLVLFGGAPDHVITAVTLLSFAAGWALLAVLSIRLTDQPQRWAIVPAGVLAVAGAGLLAWPGAIENSAVSWAWPIASLAVVVGMVRGARAHLRSRAKAWLLYPVFGVLALAAIAGLWEAVQEVRDRGALTMNGRLVDIGGRRLFLRTSGAGGPTVVLVQGAGETAESWGLIEPLVARESQVCVYDRAGRGWSESAPGPQDGRELAADLRALLSRGQVPGPYVLAGHSFGGLLALTFAAEYPQDVAGVVLLDSTYPQAFTKLRGYSTFYAGIRRASALFPSLARLGVGRLAYGANFDSLPPANRQAEFAFWCTPRHARSQRDEWAMAPALMRQAQALTTLGDRPLVVVTAAQGAMDGWLPLQDDFARLSTNCDHRVLQDASHESLVMSRSGAAHAARAIHDVVEAVRTSTVLRGS